MVLNLFLVYPFVIMSPIVVPMLLGHMAWVPTGQGLESPT